MNVLTDSSIGSQTLKLPSMKRSPVSYDVHSIAHGSLQIIANRFFQKPKKICFKCFANGRIVSNPPATGLPRQFVLYFCYDDAILLANETKRCRNAGRGYAHR